MKKSFLKPLCLNEKKKKQCSIFTVVTDYSNGNVYQEDKSTERIIPTSYSLKLHHGYGTAKSNHKVHEGYYAATDILTVKNSDSSYFFIFFTLFIQTLLFFDHFREE